MIVRGAMLTQFFFFGGGGVLGGGFSWKIQSVLCNACLIIVEHFGVAILRFQEERSIKYQ